MCKLCLKVGAAKRKLLDISNILDEMYIEMQAAVNTKRQEMKELENQFLKGYQPENTDNNKEKILNRIMQRMVYLNRLKDQDVRIDELSRLLDWIEEM